MNSAGVLVVGLLALSGFLIGGVASFWSRNRLVAGILAALAVLAVVGAILRLLPAGG